MYSEDLIPGLKFAIEHELTRREIEVFVLFLEKPLTNSEVAEVLRAMPSTIHKTVQRLKMKRLLVLKDRDSSGNYLYKINPSVVQY